MEVADDIRTKLAEARKLEAQASALDEFSRLFPENEKDIDPFVVLPRILLMHKSGALTTGMGSEERAQEIIAALQKDCDRLTVTKLRRRRKHQAIVLLVVAVLGLIWFIS